MQTETDVYQRAMEAMSDGYGVTVIPVSSVNGDGLYLHGYPLDRYKDLRAHLTSRSTKDRTAAALAMAVNANNDLPSGLYPRR